MNKELNLSYNILKNVCIDKSYVSIELNKSINKVENINEYIAVINAKKANKPIDNSASPKLMLVIVIITIKQIILIIATVIIFAIGVLFGAIGGAIGALLGLSQLLVVKSVKNVWLKLLIGAAFVVAAAAICFGVSLVVALLLA